ncbi:paraneoplastic antigen Ma3 homolog [Boleophthalmus pectinirostris]|uniref:paraneoplastic antigen Ma3 homolog n=1 Tax=Boleophthalmus pectinirostris TaxID=150288 RepID=UPI0024305A5E|nr:paraneoplastic antigen Ma3 homolog [Boleophthalmus pectinirostris]
MEFFEKSGVNVNNSVSVSGITHSSKDNEILDILKKYGKYKIIEVTDITHPLAKNLVIEFKSSSAMAELKKILPYTHTSESDPNHTYYVTTIENTATTETPPLNYMDEIKQLARRSGQKFEIVLQDLMSQISEHLDTATGGEEIAQRVEPEPPLPGQQGEFKHQIPLRLSEADINPPQIQKMVVEHVLKTEECASLSMPTLKLRSFSGKIPKPPHESDYETWRAHVELLLADVNLPPLHVTRKILESLLSPAADVVKGLKPDALPSLYLRILDSAYSTVQDGEELFAQFLNTLQDPGEKPSSYLQRLLLTLNTVVQRGGVTAADVDKYLLKQFCRGCWDNGIINKLQLEQKKERPPPFSELLYLLRTEEDRQSTKEGLMKKHIGSKQRATLLSQGACPYSHSNDPDTISLTQLKKQMDMLQKQMATLLAQTNQKSKNTYGKEYNTLGKTQNTNSRPRPGFCYKCGEDGHIVSNCNKPPNPALVQQKKAKLAQKQAQWDQNNKQKLLN